MRKRSLWLGTVNSLEFIQRDSGEIESSEYPCPERNQVTTFAHYKCPSTTGKVSHCLSLTWAGHEGSVDLQWFLSLSGWDGTWCVVLEQSVASRIRGGSVLL